MAFKVRFCILFSHPRILALLGIASIGAVLLGQPTHSEHADLSRHWFLLFMASCQVGRRLLLQIRQQLLEVLSIAKWIEVGVLRRMLRIIPALLHGLVEQFHRPVGVLVLLVCDLGAGQRIDAGEVVPLAGAPDSGAWSARRPRPPPLGPFQP